MSTAMTTRDQNANRSNDNELSRVPQEGEARYQATFSPRFDIWESDDELTLYGDLPGVGPDGLDIRFENRQLTIRGTVTRRNEGVDYLYSEYGVGDFHRNFAIGELIDAEAISAEMRDGVLTLHLPKSAKAKPRKIEVKVS